METGSKRARRWIRPRSFAIVIAVVTTCITIDACLAVFALHAVVGWPALPPPPIKVIGYNCGRVYQGEFTGFINQAYDPDQGELCLWRAYTTCHASTLIDNSQNLESAVINAITVLPESRRCAVTVTSRSYGQGVFGPRIIGSVYRCSGLTQEPSGGLLVRDCGSNTDVLLRPRPPQQVGHLCGILSGDTQAVAALAPLGVKTNVPDVETCFWQAFRSCTQPATLVYKQVAASTDPELPPVSITEHTLVVQPSHATCALTDAVLVSSPSIPQVVSYACASLSRLADGSLVARNCGPERAVTIPSAISAT